ncbi:MAG TPA: hypothetical protein QF555_05330 [Candidatus Thalassarchaeaceae archaeon]|nr:hypothetical protein [Candidatus Thalassarchaeaceae archaeon]
MAESESIMWDTIFCLAFVILVVFWIIGKGVNSTDSNHGGVQYNNSAITQHDMPQMSMEPMDVEDPVNMAMWMELGEL